MMKHTCMVQHRCMAVLADVVEHAGWTNGSLHNNMLQHNPGWLAFYMIDIAAFISAILITIICLAAYASLVFVKWIRGRFATNSKRRIVKKYN